MPHPDILLVNAGGRRADIYQDLSRSFAAVEPPFWAALTAGYLRRHGHAVSILDANVRNLDAGETVAAIVAARPRFVTLVVYGQQANTCSPLMQNIIALCRQLKQTVPELPVVVTGWHPSALPEQTLHETGADFVVQGEGFSTLHRVLAGDPPEMIPGLWRHDGDQVRGNARAENIADLDTELPEVAWDLLPLTGGGYRAFNWLCLADFSERDRCASLLTSLGCPYTCSFCAIHATFGERRVRYWSPGWVLRQLDLLAFTYGVRHVNLLDEVFVLDPEHYRPVVEGLLTRPYRLNLCAFARVDALDRMSDGELTELKHAGFNWLKLGIESADAGILQRATKGNYTVATVRRVVQRVHRAGIALCANFMFGLPGETRETMAATLALARELQCAFPSFFGAMAPPGSQLYADLRRCGAGLPDSWLGYAQQGYEFQPLATDALTAADVLRFRDEAFHTYFTDPSYLAMIERTFGAAARAHIEQMAAIRLRRRLLGD